MARRCKAAGKVRYRDKIAAQFALAGIRRADRADRPATEGRAYHCPSCYGWHLTSQVRRKAEA